MAAFPFILSATARSFERTLTTLPVIVRLTFELCCARPVPQNPAPTPGRLPPLTFIFALRIIMTILFPCLQVLTTIPLLGPEHPIVPLTTPTNIRSSSEGLLRMKRSLTGLPQTTLTFKLPVCLAQTSIVLFSLVKTLAALPPSANWLLRTCEKLKSLLITLSSSRALFETISTFPSKALGLLLTLERALV